MNPKKAKQILEKRRQQTSIPSNFFDPAFPQQKNFIDDPSKLKILWCTRRAGKSMTAAMYMVHEAITNPGCNCLAIGLTRASIKAILWKDCLYALDKKLNLRATFNKADLSVTLRNGSVIRLTGVDSDEKEMNKLLGAKYRVVCIDEGSMYTIDVRNLVYGVLKPAMTDPNAGGQRGTICMFGTSSNYTRGLFYDIATGKEPGWSLHTWTAYDNPHVNKNWKEEIEEIQRTRPLYMETPQYQQWYLNKYVVDEEKLCYKYNETKNLYRELPKLSPAGWTYTLGIDLGYDDDTAFVLTGYHTNDPNLYVIKTYNKKHMNLDHVFEHINTYLSGSMIPSKIVIDGSAKQAVETMRVRTTIPFEVADKHGKSEFIEVLNADLIQGKIKISDQCTNLINEMMSLVWKTDGNKVILPRKEHPALPNHLCDALLYNWRMSYHYHSSPATKLIPVGSREWYAKQSDEIWEREQEHLENLENKKNWPEGGEWGNL